jgi:hypothetical protein
MMLRLDHTYFDRELRPPLGALLVKKGMITQAQLDEALSERSTTGELLGQVLLRHAWVFEDELARVLAEQHNLDFVNLSLLGVDARAMTILPIDVGQRLHAVPVRVSTEGDLLVAVGDPNDTDGMNELFELLAREDRPLRLAVAEPSAIDEVWRRFAAGTPLR